MKKTDWTDRMLAALVELYPVETTAYTAAVLNPVSYTHLTLPTIA